MQRPSFIQQVTFLYTNHPARSFAFYEEVMGLPLVLDQGAARIYRTGGEAFLGICEHPKCSKARRPIASLAA
jgi:hypothetical protein